MDTSALIATYPPSLGDAPITALAFHPFDHMLACAAPGEPVEVYTFDEQTPSMERVSGATAVESQQPQQAVGGATGRETAAYMYASAMASPMARVGSPMSRVGNTGRLETATRQLAMETAAMRLSTAGSVLTGAALN